MDRAVLPLGVVGVVPHALSLLYVCVCVFARERLVDSQIKDSLHNKLHSLNIEAHGNALHDQGVSYTHYLGHLRFTRPAPSPLHRLPCTSSPAPSPLHRLSCTVSPAPALLHRLPCTGSPAPSPLHRLPCTSSPAPSPLHRLPCTGSPAPAPLHRLPCTGSPAPAPLHY